MIRSWFAFYQHTALSQFIRDSTWAFAAIEVIHLMALAILGGAALVGALGLSGVAYRFAAPRDVWRDVRGVGAAALVTLIVSGTLLVGVNPLKYYHNDAFRWKMGLLAGAVVTAIWISSQASARDPKDWPAIARLFPILNLGLWVAVGLAGRLIGLL